MNNQEQQQDAGQQRFRLGLLTLSPEAGKCLTNEEIAAYLKRHHNCDWGNEEGFAEENERSLKTTSCTSYVISKFNEQPDRVVACFTALYRNSTVLFLWDELTVPFMVEYLPGMVDL